MLSSCWCHLRCQVGPPPDCCIYSGLIVLVLSMSRNLFVCWTLDSQTLSY